MGGGGKLTDAGKKSKQITLEECAKHRTPNDAWLHMRGKVYDVSNWDDHPGECSGGALCCSSHGVSVYCC